MGVLLRGLTKSYGNNKLILDQIDLQVEAGTVYCLLGKNGAGKSTLLNILAGIIEKTNGEVLIDGFVYPGDELAIKKMMGIQSEFDQIIGELNAIDYLWWIGLLYKMDKTTLATKIENVLKYFFEDKDALIRPAKRYSSGMRKKLSICGAVLHTPKLLILDEPFANLDPLASSKLCSFINAYRSNERVILVSSHDLLYVDKVATHIGVLSNQRIAFNDTIDAFRNKDNQGSIDEELLKYLGTEKSDSSLLNALI